MRVLCDVCEKAVAAVICFADEAALCLSCDDRVHAANKLASKHQRLRLLYSSNNNISNGNKGDSKSKPSSTSCDLPTCDICQEKTAFIFCLEDRALLCRDCDLSSHPAKSLAAGHRRFLSAGVRVALNATEDCSQKPTEVSRHKPEEPRMQAPAVFKPAAPPPPTCVKPKAPSTTKHSSITNSSSARTGPIIHRTEPAIDVYGVKPVPSQAVSWHLEEVLRLPDSEVQDIDENAPSSKGDLMAFGEYDWMADLSVFDEHVFMESPAEVPDITSMFGLCPPLGKINTGVKPSKPKEDTGFVSSFNDLFVVPDMDINYDQPMQAKRQKTWQHD